VERVVLSSLILSFLSPLLPLVEISPAQLCLEEVCQPQPLEAPGEDSVAVQLVIEIVDGIVIQLERAVLETPLSSYDG
jgi:hypothetical protein